MARLPKLGWFSLSLNAILLALLVYIVYSLGGIKYLKYKMANGRFAGQYSMQKDIYNHMPKPSENAIVFIGNSLVQYGLWGEWLASPRVYNRGLAGDGIMGVKERLEALEDSKPAQLYIMAGINDLYFHPIDTVIQSHNRLLAYLDNHFPETEIRIHSVLPINNQVRRVHLRNEDIIEINRSLQAVSRSFGFQYLDLHTRLKDDQGRLDEKYTEDGIHLNGSGYRVWQAYLQPFLPASLLPIEQEPNTGTE